MAMPTSAEMTDFETDLTFTGTSSPGPRNAFSASTAPLRDTISEFSRAIPWARAIADAI